VRRRIALFLICGAPIAALIIGYLVRSEERALFQFVETYQSLHAARNVEAMVNLFYWEGVDSNHRRQLARALTEETRFPIKSIEVRPATPEDMRNHFLYAGLYPNLEPRYFLAIELDTEDMLGHSMLVGQTPSGELRAAGALSHPSNTENNP